MTKKYLKQLIKESINEYFLAIAPKKYNIYTDRYIIYDDEGNNEIQLVEEGKIVYGTQSSDLNSAKRELQLLVQHFFEGFEQLTKNRQSKSSSRIKPRNVSEVSRPEKISDTKYQMDYIEDDEKYRLVIYVKEKTLQNMYKSQIESFIKNPKSWRIHIIDRDRHLMTPFYEEAVNDINSHLSSEYDEDDDVIELFTETEYDDVEIIARYDIEEEIEFMDDLTKKYIEEYEKDGYVDDNYYVEEIKKFLKEKINQYR